MPKSIKCPKCGADLDHDSKFCDSCGTRIEPEKPAEPEKPKTARTSSFKPTRPKHPEPAKSETVEPVKPEPLPPPKPAPKHSSDAPAYGPSKPSKGRARTMIAWALAFLFAMIGFVVAFYGTSFDVTFSLFLGAIILLAVAAIRQYRPLGLVALVMVVLMIVATNVPLIKSRNQTENGDGPGPSPQPSYQGLVPPGKWTDAYGQNRAMKEATEDRIIGHIITEYDDQVREAEGVKNSTAKISMQTLLFETATTARQVYEEAAEEIEDGENYIATVKINGIEFVIYEGNSLGFIGSFADSLFHATYDVSSDTISSIRSGLSTISSSLPDFDMYWDLDLPEISTVVDPIKDVLGTAVDHVARMTRQMISQAIDITLIIGDITGINDALNEFYSFLKERGKEYVSAKVDALISGAGTAIEAAGALSDVAMATMDYAKMVDTDNVEMLYDLTKLISQDVIEKAITSAEVVKAIAGGKIGLVIDEKGVTLNLMGSHSFEHDLTELALDLGLRRFEIELLGEEIGESKVTLETTIGFSLELKSAIGIAGVEISGNVKFEGDKVRSEVQNLIGMTTGEWLTVWDWANLTISYGLGLGIPKGIFLVPGMDILVEVSRSISDNRVVKMVFDPSPEIQIQGQAGAEVKVSAHTVLGGEASVAGAINLGLDFSKIAADLGKLLDPSTNEDAASSVSSGVVDAVGEVVDINQLAGPTEEYEMDPSIQLDYLNAVSHREIVTSTGNVSATEIETDTGQSLAGYVYNILGTTLDSVASNTNVGLCLKGKAGVGVGAGGSGAEVAADFEIGLEGGMNIPIAVFLKIGAKAKEAKDELIGGLCEKGYRLLSDPSDAGSFIEQPSLLLDRDTLQSIILSVSEYRPDPGLVDIFADKISEKVDELKNDDEFKKNLANSDLYFQLSIGAKGSAELGLGTKVEAALQAVLHNNGENIINNLGWDTEELQRSSLTVGIQIGPPSMELKPIPGITLFVEAAIGADFLQIELSQKRNEKENILDLFSEIFPLTPSEPEAEISVDQSTWTQSYDTDQTAEKTITVHNTGDVAVNLMSKHPENITTDIPQTGLDIPAGGTGKVKLTADTSQKGTITGDIHLLTGLEGARQTISVNLIISTGEAEISVDETTWQDTVLRNTPLTKTFTINNIGGADYTADVVLPIWATADKITISIPARSSITLKISLDTTQDRVLIGQLVLRSGDGDTPLISITVEIGAPRISLDTDQIIRQIDLYQTTTANIEIKNHGAFDLTVNLVGQIPAWIVPDKTQITVKTGQTAKLNLQLTATSPVLQYEFNITTNDPDNPTLSIPIRIATSLTPETLERIHIGSHKVNWGAGTRLSPFADGDYVVLMGPYDRETLEKEDDYGSMWRYESVYLYDTTSHQLKRISPDPKYTDWPIHNSFIFAGPAIHGDKVVYGYQETYSNSTSIYYHNYEFTYYLYDIATGQSAELDMPLTGLDKDDTGSRSLTIVIDIYENLIVGQDNEEIWIYDLNHPEKGAVAIAREKDPTGPLPHRGTTLMYSNPVIHGDKVVYVNADESYLTSGGFVNHTIWMLDLTTRQEICLGHSKNLVAPRISQSHVAYGVQLERDLSDCRIVIHNIQTGQTTTYHHGAHAYPQMDIYQDRLVYTNFTQTYDMSPYSIYYHDITSGQTMLISPMVPAGHPRELPGPRLCAIYQDRIYYFDVVDGWTYLKTVTIS